MNIKTYPCQVYESFNGSASSTTFDLYVSRDAQDARTRVSIANRTRELSAVIYLTDDELDTLATMLRDAYNSQEREE